MLKVRLFVMSYLINKAQKGKERSGYAEDMTKEEAEQLIGSIREHRGDLTARHKQAAGSVPYRSGKDW